MRFRTAAGQNKKLKKWRHHVLHEFLLVDEIISPHPNPLPQRGEGVLAYLFQRGFRGKNNSLAPPGERVRVRGYPESVFVLND